jgi:hypothetical protein
MFIKRREYERLVNSDKIRKNLEKEVKRLAELISAKVTDCKVGPWCEGCQHIGTDDADLIGERLFEYIYVKEKAGRVTYCKKHLHEICPEFEQEDV